MIHNLQQNVEKIGVGFFNFVKKQHRMRRLIDRISQ